MKIKKGAILAGLNILMRPVLIHGEDIWKALGKEFVITCGLDSTHSAGSLHYYGLAVDIRAKYWNDDGKHEVANELRAVLGVSYNVVVHEGKNGHIHVEYDPK